MKTTIGVFFGGRSVEHEISVISALQAAAALDPARYEVVPIYITKQGRWLTGGVLLDPANYRDLPSLEKRATEVYMKPLFGERRLLSRGRLGERTLATLDVALPVLHGTNGEDGTFQGFLELTGIPYVGCGVLSSALGMDKIASKMVLRESGLPTVDYLWFTDRQWSSQRDELCARVEAEIGYPAIVKPANLGSSVGIARARDRAELVRAVGEAARYSSRLLVERMIEPLREINCSVVGSPDSHRVSVCEEPLHSDEILSYADKYMSGGGGGAKSSGGAKSAGAGAKILGAGAKILGAGAKILGAGAKAPSQGMSSTKRRIPADLPEALTREVQRLASETFRVLDCNGVARVDFILEGERVYVNEINAIPGSLSFYLWEATGVSFSDLMNMLVAGALRRDRDKDHKTVSYPANIFSMAPAGSVTSAGKAGGSAKI
jgi:D-alanine-D-alanine ligase